MFHEIYLKVLKKVVDTIRATIEDKKTARKKFENACENDQAAIIVMVLYPAIRALALIKNSNLN